MSVRKVQWKQTFTKDNKTLRNAEISFYYAGTNVAAAVYDENDNVKTSAPQVTTDSNGSIEVYFAPDEYASGQLFDCIIDPSYSNSDVDAYKLESLMILQDADGYRNFKNIFIESTLPEESGACAPQVREHDICFLTSSNNNIYTAEKNASGVLEWVDRQGSSTANWNSIIDKPSDEKLLNSYQNVGAYQQVDLPFTDGSPCAVDCYINNDSGSAHWFLVGKFDLAGTYQGASWQGHFNWGGSNGRFTSQMRVRAAAVTAGTVGAISDSTFRYSGDNLTSYLKIYYDSSGTVYFYVYLAASQSCSFDGIWACNAGAGNTWVFTLQSDSDSVSAPSGYTEISPTANYELGADITGSHTALNTTYVNGSVTQGTYEYDVYGDINMRDSSEVFFYDNSSPNVLRGKIYGGSSSNGLVVEGSVYAKLDSSYQTSIRVGNTDSISVKNSPHQMIFRVNSTNIMLLDTSDGLTTSVDIIPYGSPSLGGSASGESWNEVYADDIHADYYHVDQAVYAQIIDSNETSTLYLRYDGSNRLSINNSGVGVYGDLSVNDDVAITDDLTVGGDINTESIDSNSTNSLFLKYNGSDRLAIGSEVSFYGHLYPSIGGSYDVGSSGQGWRNIYGEDLYISDDAEIDDDLTVSGQINTKHITSNSTDSLYLRNGSTTRISVHSSGVTIYGNFTNTNGDVYLGGSSNTFTLHMNVSGTWYTYDAYITP